MECCCYVDRRCQVARSRFILESVKQPGPELLYDATSEWLRTNRHDVIRRGRSSTARRVHVLS